MLNPEQKMVVEHLDGPLLVAAVAGSGKTHALVGRIANLINVGINPQRILAVTFSRKGADEMNERLHGLIGASGARVGTFHSLAYQIILEEQLCDGWTVDNSERYRICIKDAVGFRHMKWNAADVTVLSHYISLCKSNLARPDEESTVEIAQKIRNAKPSAATNVLRMVEAYETAEEIRKERMLITFDDMLFDAVEYLNNEGARQRWASRWDYVLQDEAQDQNLGQLILGELLAQDHKNYMLVGDTAQCIYTWRGAHPEKFLGFTDKWAAKTITMARNYRCGKAIIQTANNILEAMDPRLDTQMICELGTEADVRCTKYANLDDEAENTVAEIKQLLADGTQPKDIFVLYRTNAQSRAPEEALISERIPYEIIGGVNFYERKEVKDLLAYLRLANGTGDLSDISRCINAPFRYLGKAFVEKVKDAVKSASKNGHKEIDYLHAVRAACQNTGIQTRQRYSAEDWADIIEHSHAAIEAGKHPAEILRDIIMATKYTEWLTRDEGEESPENSRVSNVLELIRAAGRFPTTSELLNYIEKTVSKSKKQKDNENQNKVTLTTIHRAKGMEKKIVYIIGANEHIIPHARAESIEEERRLFYVAITRAKEILRVSCVHEAAINNKIVNLMPSRFIAEAKIKISS